MRTLLILLFLLCGCVNTNCDFDEYGLNAFISHIEQRAGCFSCEEQCAAYCVYMHIREGETNLCKLERLYIQYLNKCNTEKFRENQ